MARYAVRIGDWSEVAWGCMVVQAFDYGMEPSGKRNDCSGLQNNWLFHNVKTFKA